MAAQLLLLPSRPPDKSLGQLPRLRSRFPLARSPVPTTRPVSASDAFGRPAGHTALCLQCCTGRATPGNSAVRAVALPAEKIARVEPPLSKMAAARFPCASAAIFLIAIWQPFDGNASAGTAFCSWAAGAGNIGPQPCRTWRQPLPPWTCVFLLPSPGSAAAATAASAGLSPRRCDRFSAFTGGNNTT